jgi:hypothetical protein
MRSRLRSMQDTYVESSPWKWCVEVYGTSDAAFWFIDSFQIEIRKCIHGKKKTKSVSHYLML